MGKGLELTQVFLNILGSGWDFPGAPFVGASLGCPLPFFNPSVGCHFFWRNTSGFCAPQGAESAPFLALFPFGFSGGGGITRLNIVVLRVCLFKTRTCEKIGRRTISYKESPGGWGTSLKNKHVEKRGRDVRVRQEMRSVKKKV